MTNSEALSEILSIYSEHSKTNREQGEYFEKLVQSFLDNDRTYSPQFISKVQNYKYWAKAQKTNAKDLGIDLVAQNADKSYTAIQCKFYKSQSKISKEDIDSFIAASDRKEFSRRILVDTTLEGLNENVLSQLENSRIPFTRISKKQIADSSINWSEYLKNKTIKSQKQKSLRPHQKKALEAVIKGFKTADRGKLIMACGSGKTYSSLKIAEALTKAGDSILFLVPSLSLMSQTIHEWSNESSSTLTSFAVCSDSEVGKNKLDSETNNESSDDLELKSHDLAYPATTDAKTLSEKVKMANEKKL